MIIRRKVVYSVYVKPIQNLIVATDLITKQITVQKRVREALKDILLGHQSTAGVTNWLWSSCVQR
jgi:hypothetical protein